MPYDWGSGFTPPAGGLLGGSGNPYEYLGNLGAGLLASSGPSFQPQGGFGPAFGKAQMYASERSDQGLLNEARRQQIVQSTRELQGQKDLADYIAKGGEIDLPTLLRFMPSETAKGIAAAYADPTLGMRSAAAAAALPGAQAESELKQAELSSAKADITGLYESAAKATDAAEYLKSLPGGESIATVSDESLKQLRKARANNWDKGLLGDLAEKYLTQIPRDQWGSALDAAEQLQKARNSIATLSAAANRAGASGLQAKLTGLGEGAGLNLQSDLFNAAVERATAASAGFTQEGKPFKLPEVDPTKYSWRAGAAPVAATGLKPPTVGATPAPSVGYQSGRLVPQPAPVYRPLPTPAPTPAPAAAAPSATPPATRGDIPYLSNLIHGIGNMFTDAPANPMQPPAVPQPQRLAPPPEPAARKVTTSIIDPATGSPAPTFPREADALRATKKGQLYMLPNPANPNDPLVYRH